MTIVEYYFLFDNLMENRWMLSTEQLDIACFKQPHGVSVDPSWHIAWKSLLLGW